MSEKEKKNSRPGWNSDRCDQTMRFPNTMNSTKTVQQQLKIRVKLDGKHYIKQISTEECVSQGSAISQTVFFIYTNDITTAVTLYVRETLHAEDFATWNSVDYASPETGRVQEMVDNVFKWIQDWGLTGNANKTAATKFSLQTKERYGNPNHELSTLPTDQAPTFFRVTPDNPLTWKQHIHKINQKVKRRSLIIKKNLSPNGERTRKY
ncbi:RNA-directed DNA polymerase from mobile element jockey [Elysia marginata]|uniref:RNA-directed DNA polymerase from mobile element jockey n=1 Tax=Elysia marginata TaxID=1093978 RepID=A0AAV4IHB7_9GAST|nr:RNA-directed DNA polymerase from mobile element jockey [Elysia marginata]